MRASFVRSIAVRVVACLSTTLLLAGCGGGGVKTGLNLEIEATPEQGAYPLAVTLKALVDGQAVAEGEATFAWDLGDGTTSTAASVTHTYSAIGEYQVELQIELGGKSGYARRTIVVGETGAGTDLAVEAIDITPLSINPGSPVTVKVSIRNRGTTATTDNFINRVYITTAATVDPTQTGVYTINMSGIEGSETIDKQASFQVPASLQPATYNVFVALDAADTVDETDETNNLVKAEQVLTVTDGSLPIDLLVSTPTASSATVAAGSNVTIDTTVTNAGTAAVGAFYVKVMISADPEITAGDVQLHSVQVMGLAGGANAPQSLTVAMPMTVDNRPWYVGVVVDPDGEIAETDETNNASSLSGLMTTTGGSGCTEDANEPNETPATATVLAAGQLPALKVCGQTADWFKMDLGIGDRLTSRIDFQNANGDLDLAVFAMTNPLAPIDASEGSANMEEVDSGVALAAGTYLVKVSMSEAASNEYSLTAALQDNGGPGIDVMPTAFTVGDGTPIPPGNAAATSLTIYNFGDAAATGFDVELYLSTDKTLGAGDTLVDSFAVTGIAAGMSDTKARSITVPAAFATGYYWVIAKTDSGNSQVEGHETNNEMAVKVGVGSGCIDDGFEPNDTIAASSVVDNGTYTDLQICMGGSPNGDVYAITTGAGGTITVVVSDMTGDLDVNLLNASNVAPSDCSSGTNDCNGVSGGTVNETVQYTSTAGGTYYVRVFGYGSAKGPYTMTVTGSTGSMPDFAPHTVTASPGSLVAGDELQVDAKIKNNSTQPTAAFQWSIRLSSDATIDGGDLMIDTFDEVAMTAGENRAVSKKVTIPETTAGGQYYVGVIADPSGAVTESTETNNAAVTATKVTVTALCGDDGFEDNDTQGSAAAMAIGGTVNGLVICGSDPDWYSFTPSTNGTLAIHADFVHSSTGDIDMKLYVGNGTSAVKSSTSVNDDEDISYAVTAGTTYKLRVYGFSGSVQFNTNTYSLAATLTP